MLATRNKATHTAPPAVQQAQGRLARAAHPNPFLPSPPNPTCISQPQQTLPTLKHRKHFNLSFACRAPLGI
jgi:hypothetical protein